MKTDGRVKYTRMMLKNGLIELLREKPINRVTVTEVCALAGVNRATFYSHYTDVFDLLEQIENELAMDIIASLSETEPNDIGRMLEGIIAHVHKNAGLCSVLFSEYGDKEFLRRVVEVGRESGIAQWRRLYPKSDPKLTELLYTYIAHGSMAVIERWVTGGMTEQPREIAGVIERFSSSSIAALKES